MKRVLVTGGTGFIGRHCIDPLRRRGFEVIAGSRRSGAEAAGATTVALDFTDPAAVRGLLAVRRPTHLLHLAWDLVPGSGLTADTNAHLAAASVDLLAAFVQAGGSRFVGAGTCFEYDVGLGICREDTTPIAPATAYGAAKAEAGKAVIDAAVTGGLSTAWARIFYVYGPHEHPARLVPSVARAVLEGRPAPMTHGRQVRDYLYVTDVAEALAALVDSPVQGPFNVASGETVTLLDLARLVASAAGQPGLLQAGAVPERPNDPPRVVGDAGRLRAKVGWRPVVGLGRRGGNRRMVEKPEGRNGAMSEDIVVVEPGWPGAGQ
ncbi:MAG: NAD(P)-dependent oxidoreductase [Gemmatimonadales bacterium]